MAAIIKIERPGGTVYKAVIKSHGKYLKSKCFTRKTDATNWAKRIEGDQELVESLGSAGAVMRFSELADEYIAQWQGVSSNQATRLAYWVEAFGSHRLNAITPELIRHRMKILIAEPIKMRMVGGKVKVFDKVRAPKTTNSYLQVLGSAFKYAIFNGYVTVNPVLRVARRKDNNMRNRFLSDGERDCLLAACKQSSWEKLHLCVLMALVTGMRQAELLNLRWCDIDFNRGIASLARTKNGEPRLCPIPRFVLDELAAWRQVGNGLLFPSAIKPDRPFEFKKHWFRALRQAGIEAFRWHDLRHTSASWLVQGGATLYETGQILGHKSLQSTERYAHLSVEHKSKLLDRVMSKAVKL